MEDKARAQAARLTCWQGPVDPVPVPGGLTNRNFVVVDRGERYFVRVGHDLPAHGVVRSHELAVSRAAHQAGVSPAVVHAEPGALVLRFVEGRTLSAADLKDDATLDAVADLLRRCHDGVGGHVRGPALAFWPFAVVQGYARDLREAGSRHAPALPGLLDHAAALARQVGPVTLTMCHNDLLPQNLLHDGRRLWLVDWDYAGMNTPLFDLAGLASNCELDAAATDRLLARWAGRAPDDGLRRQVHALRCTSLLREALWSMVSELSPTVDVDFAAYTALNLERFHRALGGSP